MRLLLAIAISVGLVAGVLFLFLGLERDRAIDPTKENET